MTGQRLFHPGAESQQGRVIHSCYYWTLKRDLAQQQSALDLPLNMAVRRGVGLFTAKKRGSEYDGAGGAAYPERAGRAAGPDGLGEEAGTDSDGGKAVRTADGAAGPAGADGVEAGGAAGFWVERAGRLSALD